ncbi:cytochrome P450 [Aspergillus avenaceus]|uniref:Cytochrome P450 n=1 Tax=Aspergillus avenaceus TaxID=36643 RepID=A0A5N6TPJ6_ASPAV|nr:cytochrome P450 [Aspergillus avenaceus]
MIRSFVGQLAPETVALFFLGMVVLAGILLKLQVSMKIARLGSRAPRIRFYLPYAIDFMYRTIKAGNTGQRLTYWEDTILVSNEASDLNSPKTTELDAGISNRMIFTKDPVNIKAVLADQFADYGRGVSFHRDSREFLGDSIFNTDGESWYRSRNLIRPMFARERLVDTEIFEDHVQRLISCLAGDTSPNGSRVVDIGPLVFRYSLDAATDYLLGQGTDSLQNSQTMFADAFQKVLHHQVVIYRMSGFNFILPKAQFRRNLKVMDDFLKPYIDRTLNLSAAELDRKLSKKDTFLDSLAGFTRDRQVIRDQLVAVLLAGRDTTAGTLAFCIFELSRNPDVVAKLRQEINSQLGLDPNSRRPTYADLKEMKYLAAVLSETMRLYPAVPFNIRTALRDTTLPRGGGPDGLSPIGILANTPIFYSTILMHQDPTNYGPPGSPNYFDPKKFLPQRWLSGWQPKPWHFIPFNGGPRICLGQQFALIEMGYTIVRVIQAFKQIIAHPSKGKDKVDDPVLRVEITLSPGSELNCAFVKDDESRVQVSVQLIPQARVK